MTQSEHSYFTISELAQEFDISTRTIRYYEEIELIRPERSEKGARRYSKGDRARLKLILRGKRFGFSLDEIKEMIHLFSEDRSGVKQLEKTIHYGDEKLLLIDNQIKELVALREDIMEYKVKFEEQLKVTKEHQK